MKGKYPPHFCNGVWGFYHDFVPWNCYFHYNAQLGYFPLETANHPELTLTYHNFRRSQLDSAKHFARTVKNSKGAFYTDVSDYKGRFTKNTKDNCTCGSQIAMSMYQHYLYTNDQEFLDNIALPVMLETAEYYLDNLKLSDDGYYHIYQTQGYEGSPLFNDSITDHVMIRTLFSALITVLPCDKAKVYKERLNALAPFIFDKFLDTELDQDGKFAVGIGKGLTPKTDKVLSVGISEDGQKMRKTCNDPKKDFYGFPDTEMSLLFPSSLIGLNDKDDDLFKAVYNSCCLHTEVNFNPEKGTAPKYCMGWCLMPIYLARLGESDLLKKQLNETVSGWITFPQGFNSYTPNDHTQNILTDRFHKHSAKECFFSGRQSTIPSFNFRHFDYETLPILCTAVNESLIQSYNKILRLFPAVSKTDTLAFSLVAVGGFSVTATFDNGNFFAKIDSRLGSKLQIIFDNIDGEILFFDTNGTPLYPNEQNGLYTIQTTKGQTIYAKTKTQPSFLKAYHQNNDAKTLGTSQLGVCKFF
jgi:hypothetical protein